MAFIWYHRSYVDKCHEAPVHNQNINSRLGRSICSSLCRCPAVGQNVPDLSVSSTVPSAGLGFNKMINERKKGSINVLTTLPSQSLSSFISETDLIIVSPVRLTVAEGWGWTAFTALSLSPSTWLGRRDVLSKGQLAKASSSGLLLSRGLRVGGARPKTRPADFSEKAILLLSDRNGFCCLPPHCGVCARSRGLSLQEVVPTASEKRHCPGLVPGL